MSNFDAKFDAKSNLQLLIVLLLKVQKCSLKWDACKKTLLSKYGVFRN